MTPQSTLARHSKDTVERNTLQPNSFITVENITVSINKHSKIRKSTNKAIEEASDKVRRARIDLRTPQIYM